MTRRLLVAVLALFTVGTVVAPPAGAMVPADVPTSGYSICVAVMGVGGVCV